MKNPKVKRATTVAPSKISSRKVSSLESEYLKSAKSDLNKYRKTGSQSDLMESFKSGRQAAMLNPSVVKSKTANSIKNKIKNGIKPNKK